MSGRPSFSRSSSMIVHVGEPSPVLRSPSHRPSNNPRTTSYHGLGSNHGTRVSDHARPSLPQRRNSTRMTLPSRVDTALVENISNRATAGSGRTIQSSFVLPNSRSGQRGTLVRQHQGLQQMVNRNPLGHRNEFRRTESTNIPQYRYSNTRGRLPAAPIQRSQYRPPTATYNGRGGRCTDAIGTEHAREIQSQGQSQSLVRVGGRVVHPRRQ